MYDATLLIGILSVLQIIFIPGCLLLNLMHYRTSKMEFFVLTFVLSLLANYVLIYFLVMFNLYTPMIYRIVLVSEVILLLLLNYKYLVSQPLLYNHKYTKQKYPILLSLSENSTFENLIVFVSLCCVIYFANIFLLNLGSVFTGWDAVLAWNYWAKAWAHNIMPPSGLYPQLLSTNISIPYVLIPHKAGTPYVLMFSKSIMPLFSIVTFLALLDLGLKTKKTYYFLAVILTSCVLFKELHEYIAAGYADIPLSTLVFVSIYHLYNISLKKETNWKDHMIAAMIAGTCGIMKQGGLYVSLIFPLIYYLIVTKNKQQNIINILCLQYLIILSIILPWYLQVEQNFKNGLQLYNVHYLTHDIYIKNHQADFLSRVKNVLKMISFFVLPYMLLSIYSIKLSRFWKIITLTITLPYILLWAFFFSYDFRNIAGAIPLLSVTAAMGLHSILKKERSYLKYVRPIYFVILLTYITVHISFTRHNNYNSLMRHQTVYLYEEIIKHREYLFNQFNKGEPDLYIALKDELLKSLKATYDNTKFKTMIPNTHIVFDKCNASTDKDKTPKRESELIECRVDLSFPKVPRK